MTAPRPAPDKSWVKTTGKVARRIAKVKRTEAQIRAIVRQELDSALFRHNVDTATANIPVVTPMGVSYVTGDEFAAALGDQSSRAINNGEPMSVMLSSREYDRYLGGALNEASSDSPSPTAVSVGDGSRSGVEDHPAPAADHPTLDDFVAHRVNTIAAALPVSFSIAYCPTTVDRRVVVAEVLAAMDAVQKEGL